MGSRAFAQGIIGQNNNGPQEAYGFQWQLSGWRPQGRRPWGWLICPGVKPSAILRQAQEKRPLFGPSIPAGGMSRRFGGRGLGVEPGAAPHGKKSRKAGFYLALRPGGGYNRLNNGVAWGGRITLIHVQCRFLG